ncbi:glucokinase regulatory protein isoform X2 [Amia ocellicauda]|uniref:glucokinase regulatory protein isoform X2 n=1 Tax=Amia ocellicauda TaxID=2972642 RepID=UPI003464C91F
MSGSWKHCHSIETADIEMWQLAGYEASLSLTEKSNPITREIDTADPLQIVHLLQMCDAEIFQEERREGKTIVDYQRLYSESVLQTLISVAKKVEEILKDPEHSLVLLSGCGTSGRLAFLLATSFNRLLKALQRKQNYAYMIAGGDKALLTSQEDAEDNPHLGAEELGKAPFIAGQLDFCMDNLDVFTPVLLGFNPVTTARNEVIEGWHLSFCQVAKRMQDLQKTHRAFILNPAVGPEAISGSSRMKGGSATKIILETLFLTAHRAAFSHKEITAEVVLEGLRTYERVHKSTYSQNNKIAALVKQAGRSLQKRGHVYYIGWKTLGVMGIIDASECIPTFGADASDICGFINNGYREMENKEGDITSQGPQFCISHEDFVKNILPHVTDNDTILFIFTLDDDLSEIEELANQTTEKSSNLHAVAHTTAGHFISENLKKSFASVISITWPVVFSEFEGCFLQKLQRELSTKWILNAISSGGHILKGKIYNNYMMDLKVSNTKLYRRALAILQKFTGHSHPECQEALLQAIYDTQDLSDDIRNAEVTKHTYMANTKNRVVPTAVVILTRKCSLAEAKSRLDATSVIRDAIEACLVAPGWKRVGQITAGELEGNE